MSKMSEMEATIRELRDIASSINDIANWLTGAFSGTEEAAPSPEPERHSPSKRSERFWQKSPVMASPLRSVTFS